MTTNTLLTASVLRYKPRNTNYSVLHHNVKVKQRIGLLELVLYKLYLINKPPSWGLGCVYQDINEGSIYTRPYSMFDDRWVVIK